MHQMCLGQVLIELGLQEIVPKYESKPKMIKINMIQVCEK